MNFRILGALIFTLEITGWGNQSFAEPEHHWRNVYFCDLTSIPYAYSQEVTSQQALALPSWNPETTACPMSLSAILHITRSRLSREYPETKTWKIAGFTLQPLQNTDKWIYRIRFYTGSKNGSISTKGDTSIIVAVNGWLPNLDKVLRPEDQLERIKLSNEISESFKTNNLHPLSNTKRSFLTYFMGTNYTQRVTTFQASTHPSWNPETESCPLSLKEAIHIAQSRLSSELPNIKGWKLNELSLYPIFLGSDKWVYEICFSNAGIDELHPENQQGMSIVVALNGWTPDIEIINKAEQTSTNSFQDIATKADEL